jgi:hypothetical protein
MATTTTDSALRRKMIADLLAQGSSGAPVQHWTQGLNRLAQGLFGGIQAGQLRAEEQAAKAQTEADSEYSDLVAKWPTAQATQPSPVAAALAGPQQPAGPVQMASLGNQPTSPSDVTATGPHQTRGVIKGNLSDEPVMGMSVDGQPQPQPTRVAQALAPPMAQPQPMQAQPLPQQPPSDGMVSYIDSLIKSQNKKDRGLGVKLKTDYVTERMKQDNDIRKYEYAVSQGYKGSLVDFQTQMKKAGAQSISVNSTVNPFLKGVGDDALKDREFAKNAATRAIPDIHEAKKALDAGAITGAGADIRLMAAKVGGLFGMDTSTVANTEQLRAMISSAALDNIKKLGANPSNVDLKFIKDVVGSNIALDEKTLRRLLDIQEKYARQAIRNYNAVAKKMIDADPETFGKIAPAMQFDEPPEYQRQPTPEEIQQELKRRGLR